MGKINFQNCGHIFPEKKLIGTTEIKNYLMSMKREGEIREPLNKGENAQNLH